MKIEKILSMKSKSSRRSLTAPSSHTTVRAMSHTAVLDLRIITFVFFLKDYLGMTLCC